MAKRYLIVGGWVWSRSDRQRHWVGPARLVELYGLRRADCVLALDDDDARRQLLGVDRAGLVVLGPDPSGRYVLPVGVTRP